MSLTEMKKLYVDEAHKAGFSSDEEVVAAWCNNPVKWAKLFSIRMNILSIMSLSMCS